MRFSSVIRSWLGGLGNAFRVLVLVLLLVLVLAGCGRNGGGNSGAAVPCDDAAFRGQDEELYVTQAAVSNAIGAGGDPATLLLDLRRARTALAEYLDRHPPCNDALVGIATTERGAITALDGAIAKLEEGADAGTPLARTLRGLESAQTELSTTR